MTSNFRNLFFSFGMVVSDFSCCVWTVTYSELNILSLLDFHVNSWFWLVKCVTLKGKTKSHVNDHFSGSRLYSQWLQYDMNTELVAVNWLFNSSLQIAMLLNWRSVSVLFYFIFLFLGGSLCCSSRALCMIVIIKMWVSLGLVIMAKVRDLSAEKSLFCTGLLLHVQFSNFSLVICFLPFHEELFELKCDSMG